MSEPYDKNAECIHSPWLPWCPDAQDVVESSKTPNKKPSQPEIDARQGASNAKKGGTVDNVDARPTNGRKNDDWIMPALPKQESTPGKTQQDMKDAPKDASPVSKIPDPSNEKTVTQPPVNKDVSNGQNNYVPISSPMFPIGNPTQHTVTSQIPSSRTTSSNHRYSTSSLLAIIGGAVGALLIVLAVSFWAWRASKAKRKRDEALMAAYSRKAAKTADSTLSSHRKQATASVHGTGSPFTRAPGGKRSSHALHNQSSRHALNRPDTASMYSVEPPHRNRVSGHLNNAYVPTTTIPMPHQSIYQSQPVHRTSSINNLHNHPMPMGATVQRIPTNSTTSSHSSDVHTKANQNIRQPYLFYPSNATTNDPVQPEPYRPPTMSEYGTADMTSASKGAQDAQVASQAVPDLSTPAVGHYVYGPDGQLYFVPK